MKRLACVFRSDKIAVERDAGTGNYWISLIDEGELQTSRTPQETELLLIEAIQSLSNVKFPRLGDG